MRRVLAVLAVLALGVASASAAGGLGVFGSYIDTEDPGTASGGGIKFKFDLAEPLAIEFRASYLTGFDPDDEVKDLLEDMELVPLEANLVFNLPMGDAATVCLGGGGGYYILPEFEVESGIPGEASTDVDPDDEFGFFALAGIELSLNENVALFAEAQYRWLEVDSAEIDDEDVDFGDDGVIFDGFGANAGLLFKW